MDEANVGGLLYCIGLFNSLFDNTNAINISKTPVQHSRTKHIDIRHHFIRKLVENKTIALEYVETEKQLVNIFNRALDFVKFDSLRTILGIYVI